MPQQQQAKSAAPSFGNGGAGGFPFPDATSTPSLSLSRAPTAGINHSSSALSTSASPSPAHSSPLLAPLSPTSHYLSALPPIPPLDYAALSTSSEATHEELERVLRGLGEWLEVLGGGLGKVLSGEVEVGVELNEFAGGGGGGGGEGVAV